MKFPRNTKPVLWGAASGALVLAIVGFAWGGWMIASTASKQVAAAAHDSHVMALAPICAERFRTDTDAAMKLGELRTASRWDRPRIIEAGGWATMAGDKSPDSDVARACARILSATPTPKA
jgi:hypothetical protein